MFHNGDPWKSPLCSLYCFQNPGARVRGSSSDADYPTLCCNKKNDWELVNVQNHFTKVSGNLNAISEYILPSPLCIYLCTGQELNENRHREIKWLSQGHAKTCCLAFCIQTRYTWEQSCPTFLLFSEINTPRSWRCLCLPFYARWSLIWVYRRHWRQLSLFWDAVQCLYNDINRHSQLCYSVSDQGLACLHFRICLWILK